MARVLYTPDRPIFTQTWAALQQDSTLAHFAVHRQAALGQIYTQLDQLQTDFAKISELRGELDALGGKLDLSPDAKLAILEKLTTLKSVDGHSSLTAKQIVAVLDKAGLQPDQADAEMAVRMSTKTGSLRRCHEQGLPTADWRDAVDRQSRATPQLFKEVDAKD